MEQYKTIAKQITGIYLIKVVEMALLFVLFMALTRFLSAYEYGIYSILSITILFFTGLFDMGFSAFIIKDLSGLNEEKKKRFSKIFTFSTIIVLIGGIILYSLGVLLFKTFNYSGLNIIFLWVVLTSILILFGNYISAYFVSEKNTVKAKIFEFLFQNFWALTIILLAFSYRISINSIFFTKFILTLSVFVIVLIYLKNKNFKFFSKIDKPYIQKALIYGLPLSTLTISQWIINATDKYLLGIFQSGSSVGYYSYIYTMFGFIFLISSAIIDIALFPYIMEAHNKNIKEKSNFLLSASLKYSLAIVIPAITGFFILSKEIITMISGEKYILAISIIPFLMLFPFLNTLVNVFQKPFLLENKTKIIALTYSAGVVINVVLNLLLIPKFSYYGAGIAISITYLALFLIFFIKSRNYIKLDWKFIRIERIILSTIIMLLCIAFIHPQNFITKILTILLGIIAYAAGIYLTKAYVKEEMNLIKSLFEKKSRG